MFTLQSNLGLAGVVLWMFLLPQSVSAAETEEVPNPQLTQAQLKQKIAEAEQATAEAQLATAKAKLGSIGTTLPSGAITTESVHIEGTILAYRAVDKVASTIAGKITAPKVILFSSKDLSALQTYQAFKFQTDLLVSRFPAIITKPALGDPKNCAAPPKKKIAPLLAIDTALQLISLFKKDREIKGNDVTLDEFAVYAAVAQKLVSAGKEVVYPPSYFPSAFSTIPPKLGTQENIQKLSDNLPLLTQFASDMAELKKTLTAAKEKASAKCKEIYEADIANVETAQSQATSVSTAITQILAAVSAVDAASGLTMIERLSTAEQLAKGFPDASILQVKSVAAGGNTQTTKGAFSSKISFGGGAVISYMLIDNTGKVTTAGTLPAYGGYVSAESIACLADDQDCSTKKKEN